MKYKTRYVLFGKMKGVEYFMKLPDQLKDIVYRLLQEPTLDNFRNFLKGQTGEHNSIDFKEKWIEPTKLVKEMLAIANSGGGIIIFGVKEKEDKSFSYDGIEEIVDKAKISNDIKNYISTELKCLKEIGEYVQLRILWNYIREILNRLKNRLLIL